MTGKITAAKLPNAASWLATDSVSLPLSSRAVAETHELGLLTSPRIPMSLDHDNGTGIDS